MVRFSWSHCRSTGSRTTWRRSRDSSRLKPEYFPGSVITHSRSAERWAQRKDMFRVTVEEDFSAGHALRGYRGKCENLHGHNYKVQITVEGAQLDSIGLLCDFLHLKQIIRGIVQGLDHQRSEEHTSELQSPCNLVCRLLLEKKRDGGSVTLLRVAGSRLVPVL